MTPADIIRMAREAGINAESDTLCRYGGWIEPIERFAAIVAAEATKAEREACAKVCENLWLLESYPGSGARGCVDAIRARGTP